MQVPQATDAAVNEVLAEHGSKPVTFSDLLTLASSPMSRHTARRLVARNRHVVTNPGLASPFGLTYGMACSC